ncbi:hypothetical protein [Dyella sp. S184]|uniref:hypothetical protein n=1 Tax=Dyella sp. S184 TaxID=1641862 RepID=UPI00131A916C|nr:hypothetical protein [Dyella sp. S184]
MDEIKVGDAQEFTFVTASGRFYQTAIQFAGRGDYVPSFCQTAKPSRTNVPSFSPNMPMNARGGVAAQFLELAKHAERLEKIVEVFIHTGPKLISKEQIEAIYPGVVVVWEQ